MQNRHRVLVVILAVMSVYMLGCSDRQQPLSVQPTDTGADWPPIAFGATSSGPSPVALDGYSVQFDGRQYDGNQTTFSYTVSNAGASRPLSNFAVQLPDCAPPPLSTSPSGGAVGVNLETGMHSVRWDGALPAGGSQSYSITFAGDVPMGVVWAALKAACDDQLQGGGVFRNSCAGVPELGVVAGPCGGFEISGTVYVDANANGSSDVAELGIDNVTVALIDSSGGSETCTTDASGAFSFFRMEGTFTIRIDSVTTAMDFNEALYESFDATGPTFVTITVGPDSPDNDFGFNPQAEELIQEFETGELVSTGEPAKFWRREVRWAIKGGKRNSEYDPSTLLDFITQIQGLFLEDPFQFTMGPGVDPRVALREAFDILHEKGPKDDLSVLRRELLAAEFNHVSGKGIAEEAGLQAVLISWAESVAAQAAAEGEGAPPANAPVTDGPEAGAAGTTSVKDAGQLMRGINNATGGGSGGEG